MSKDNEILEELKLINKRLDRIIAIQKSKILKERKESASELSWFYMVIVLLLGFYKEEEENV